jgi:hypothetical protein
MPLNSPSEHIPGFEYRVTALPSSARSPNSVPPMSFLNPLPGLAGHIRGLPFFCFIMPCVLHRSCVYKTRRRSTGYLKRVARGSLLGGSPTSSLCAKRKS